MTSSQCFTISYAQFALGVTTPCGSFPQTRHEIRGRSSVGPNFRGLYAPPCYGSARTAMHDSRHSRPVLHPDVQQVVYCPQPLTEGRSTSAMVYFPYLELQTHGVSVNCFSPVLGVLILGVLSRGV